MPVNAVAENVFGTIGTVCWCIQLVPQAWKSWREKSTYGLSPWLMLIWALAALPLGVYNVAQNVNIPLMVQPQLFGSLACTCWVQCFYYDLHFSKLKTLSIFFGFLFLYGGLEVAFVFAVRHGLEENNDRPLQFFGVMTAILLFAGLIPQYYEIWRLKEVRGVSMLFMLVDGLGGLFSTLSLAFKPSLDPLLSFSYISVVVLDTGVMLLSVILNPIARRRRAREGSGTIADQPAEVNVIDIQMTGGKKSQMDHLGGPSPLPESKGRRTSEEGLCLHQVRDVQTEIPEEDNDTAVVSV
ncbi:hypothetical protein DACRYDRAFT_64653 [Dacryopinax primogenitus]|uniref:PQ-loop-domain-containing protein n=1 Tax=Dacryopinax primogenitus (strain DJM 731) TaxID=1858805 RepID=M5G4P9_DACPD|nr:uncharacterized protein DACRYDRAFT_64653 [Dacryopinax primogenitus]EJU03659.1 hypothetical protein DACRYDRAFT_64653 [Dacryopinax primogenitus]